MQSLEATWPPVAGFLDALRRESRHQCRANAYLTPSNSSGFSSHRDGHDVFVAQLAGSKEWVIEDQALTLAQGDVVYIPAGLAHSAVTRDVASLHLTIGVFPTRMDTVVDDCLEAEPLLARRAPFGVEPTPDALHATLDAALDTLHDAAYPPHRNHDVGVQPSARSFVPFDRRGLLDGAVSWASVDFNSTVRWATVSPTWQPSETPGVDRVLLHDRVLRVPSVVRAEIERIVSASDGIAVANLMGLSPASRVTVARRLVREGACVIAR
jgi:hypothetical protein